MKKKISLILAFLVVFFVLTGCQGEPKTSGEATGDTAEESTVETADDTTKDDKMAGDENVDKLEIRIAGLKGPTSIGMVELMESAQQENTSNKYVFNIFGSADEITPKLIQGDLDIAAVPSNLASVLYNNTDGAVKLLAVNTLGVLYIVETGNTITSFDDLRGKTIYCTGKGSAPEYGLRYLLSQNGIDPDKDVTLEWKSEPTEVVSLLSQSGDGVAMLPQPYVVVAQSKLENLRIAINLDQEWANLDNGSLMITGVLVVRNDFAQQYPQQVEAFLDEYKKSTEYVNSNVSEAAQLVEKFNIFNAAVAEKAIPYCNISYLEGSEMKTAMEGYLNVLFEQNPKSVGGKLPGEDFYYER
jgi:NitT/TauT family transport system substrate-binding protein